jgi:hypothetical protein
VATRTTSFGVSDEDRPSGKGPIFEARYGSSCSVCGDRIEPGDMIRADGDGEGGFEHEEHSEGL